MNVLTGRTFREVVEIQIVMAPFAVTVVKAIKIQTLNSGEVLRYKGDWQAASGGALLLQEYQHRHTSRYYYRRYRCPKHH